MVNRVEKIIGSAEKNRVGREPEPQVFFLHLIIKASYFDSRFWACVVNCNGGDAPTVPPGITAVSYTHPMPKATICVNKIVGMTT